MSEYYYNILSSQFKQLQGIRILNNNIQQAGKRIAPKKSTSIRHLFVCLCLAVINDYYVFALVHAIQAVFAAVCISSE